MCPPVISSRFSKTLRSSGISGEVLVAKSLGEDFKDLTLGPNFLGKVTWEPRKLPGVKVERKGELPVSQRDASWHLAKTGNDAEGAVPD